MSGGVQIAGQTTKAMGRMAHTVWLPTAFLEPSAQNMHRTPHPPGVEIGSSGVSCQDSDSEEELHQT